MNTLPDELQSKIFQMTSFKQCIENDRSFDAVMLGKKRILKIEFFQNNCKRFLIISFVDGKWKLYYEMEKFYLIVSNFESLKELVYTYCNEYNDRYSYKNSFDYMKFIFDETIEDTDIGRNLFIAHTSCKFLKTYIDKIMNMYLDGEMECEKIPNEYQDWYRNY